MTIEPRAASPNGRCRWAAACVACGLVLVGAPRSAQALDLSAAYYGDTITHPGLKLGAGVPLLERGQHLIFGAANLGYFHHERNSENLFANAEAAYRFTFSFGLYLDLALGAGYMHTFADGPIYTVEDGAVRRAANTGHPLFMPSAGLGVGYLLGPGPKGGPLTIYIESSFFGQYPRDHLFVGRLALEVGLAWTLPAPSGEG